MLIAAFLGYLLLVCAPLAVAFVSDAGRALERRPSWDDFGSALAMVGFAAILVEFVLLGRFRPLSTSLGSDYLMQAHQLLARTALAFIVIHPFFYSLWGDAHRVSDTTYAKALHIDGLSLLTGSIAWILLLSIVFSATKRQGYDYDRWRFWHAVMAVLLVVFGMHHTLSAGRYTHFTSLDRYWWLLASLAALAIITVYIIRPLLQKARAYVVRAIQQQASDIVELAITPKQGYRLRFQAGQFAWIKMGSTAVTHDHPFSIASSPKENGEIRFLIKSAGDFTSSLAQTPPGTAVYLDGPHGHFQIPDRASAVIMIAGGIGIAPFVGLLEDCADRNDSRPIRLIYGNRLASQQVDVAKASNTAHLANFRLIHVVGEPRPGDDVITGQLDAAVLSELLEQPDIAAMRDRAVFMVCGPAVMIDAVERSLTGLGVPLSQIISEKFQYDFDLKAPRSRRTMAVWLLGSAALLAAALASALR